MKTINEVIGGWLLEKGNSKARLAEELGVSRPTLDAKLSGKTDWLWSQVCTICAITDTDLSELEWGE